MPTTTPTRLPAVGLRVLHAMCSTVPPSAGSRCYGGLSGHLEPVDRVPLPPRATVTLVVILQPADGGPGTVTATLDLCDACAAALPAAR